MRQSFILVLGVIASATSIIPVAKAQGMYVSAGAGLQWEQGKITQETGRTVRVRPDGGDTAHVALGFRLGQMRVEGEVLHMGADNLGRAGSKTSWAGMTNVLYDIQIPPRLGIHPYVGAGLGFMATSLDGAGASLGGTRRSDTWTGPAWQAMVGVAIPTSIDGLLMTAEYRATAPIGREHFDLGLSGGRLSSSPVNHSILLGIRWEWESGRMLAGTPAMVSTVPRSLATAESRSFSPEFETGSSSLTNEGKTVLGRASIAANSAAVLISVSGKGNSVLAEKRAWVAVGELVRHGVPQESITVNGRHTGTGNADGPETRVSWVP